MLDWMEEDPVDTWEMGRNDAVQAITGTRNVFVDYPEYAWLLFGKEIPEDMVTPSGMAQGGVVTPPASSEDSSSVESSKPDSSIEDSSEAGSSEEEVCNHKFGEWVVTKNATKTEEGEEKRTCTLCGEEETKSIPIIKDDDPSVSVTPGPDDSDEEEVCEHQFSNWIVTKQPTEMEEGQQKRVCMLCGEGESKVIPKICNHEFTDWITTKEPTETEAGERKRLCTICHEGEKETIPALAKGGQESFQGRHGLCNGRSSGGAASRGVEGVL